MIDENPPNLNDYGLSTPRIEIDFKATGDKDSGSCRLARRRRPAATCSPGATTTRRCFSSRRFRRSTFNRSTFDLRDKTLLKFERDKVDALDVDAGGKTIEFAKDGGDWKMTKPCRRAPTSAPSKAWSDGCRRRR